MKKTAYTVVAVSIVCLVSSNQLLARGGRGGGGGGGRGGGGGGYSRPAPSRSPSVSRPSASRPTTRPSTGARPSTGTRPNSGARPSTGTRPSQSQLQGFLDPSRPSAGGPAAGAAAGGAAAAFLNNPGAGQRPNTGQRPGQRPGAGSGRPGTGDRLAGNRPDRITDRGQRQEQRVGRRDEVRDQFRDHHPRYDFWRDNPNWARFRLNRPYRWATWGAVSGLFSSWGWTDSSTYAYGDNIYYEDDQVYYGDQAVASSEDYAEQAQTIAESAPEADEAAEWLPLGVFAITQDGEASGPPPTLFVQLAINKQGIMAGTFQNTATEKSQSVEGMVDQKTQRSAWGITGKSWPIMETGISNLTEDSAPALVHFEDGQTQQWLLVRLEEPEGEAATQ